MLTMLSVDDRNISSLYKQNQGEYTCNQDNFEPDGYHSKIISVVKQVADAVCKQRSDIQDMIQELWESEKHACRKEQKQYQENVENVLETR